MSSIIGFTFAVLMLAVAFTALLVYAQAPMFSHREHPDLDARARGGAEVLLGSPGVAEGGIAWVRDPDRIARLGLALPGAPYALDASKIRNLTKGDFAADPDNGYLDYEEARRALGLGDVDFHLRTYAVRPSISELEHPVRDLRVAYVGDFRDGHGRRPPVEEGSSMSERGYLDYLVLGWDARLYDQGGNVYPDIKQVLDNDLANNLTAGHYDALVIGSEVDMDALTSAQTKFSIQDFVLGGGLLVVLGSANQQVTWMQPLLHVTLEPFDEPLVAPDPTHPILHVPEELRFQDYPDDGTSWSFNTEEQASHFVHVITREGVSPTADRLAISKPGHFGNGTIILTGWTPYALTWPHDELEAKRVVYNFLANAQGLAVELGPPIPRYAEVASATRTATVPGGWVRGEDVMIRVVFYVFA